MGKLFRIVSTVILLLYYCYFYCIRKNGKLSKNIKHSYTSLYHFQKYFLHMEQGPDHNIAALMSFGVDLLQIFYSGFFS